MADIFGQTNCTGLLILKFNTLKFDDVNRLLQPKYSAQKNGILKVANFLNIYCVSAT